jgi:hypothetical protein
MIPASFKRVLYVMSRARSPISIEYITIHADIKHPYEILSQMEKEHFIERHPVSKWSSSGDPIFRITPKATTFLLDNNQTS